MAASLVSCIAPICAGSSLPEAKGYLNGNHIRGLFKVEVFVVRVLGAILATAAGFPIGREGPMVGIGGCIGYGVVHFVALPYVRHWVKVDTSGEGAAQSSPALIVDEERFAHAKRVGFTLGGAAGIATAFDAPIGGILYMFEEATMTTWPPELTFRAFVATVCGAMASRALFNLAGEDVHRLVIYVEEREDRRSWDWLDVPFFIALAATTGLFSAVFTKMLVMVWSLRKSMSQRLQRWQPYLKIAECSLYAAICAFMFVLIPLMADCVSLEAVNQDVADPPRRLEEETTLSLKYSHHICPGSQVNEAATLLLKSSEGAVKHLLSRSPGHGGIQPMALALGTYSLLAVGMAGLSVPMGNFLPSMLIGALLGRIFGEAIEGLDLDLADAGVYSLVGSAAMLSGFTHMTLAIVVILLEAAQDLSLISPIMLTIFVSHIVSTLASRHSYDEELILRKGVPFLEPELPSEMDSHGVTAADLCEELHSDAILPKEASIPIVRAALQRREVANFPVVSEGMVVGLISRPRLETAMRARGIVWRQDAEEDEDEGHDDAANSLHGRCSRGELSEEDADVEMDKVIQGMCSTPPASRVNALHLPEPDPSEALMREDAIPVHRIMDPSPYTLLEDMPAPRLYPLFTRTCTHAACVISKRGEFRGLLLRGNLISAANDSLRPMRFQGRRYQNLP